MKTTFKFIIAAMAAISVFSSCQKELANESVSNTTDGVRTISVQFDNSTKASLSGFIPSFTNGDKIRVSNTEKSEECTVSVDGSDNATFTTTLSGALTAIYPSTAAVLSSGEADAPIASSNNFKVLATQDGTVEKAIIASATVAEGVTTATFNGVTALFEITPPSTAKKITVTSLKKVESGSRTGTAADINTEDTGKTVITVGDGSADLPGTIYVALVPGVNLTDLSFDAGEAVGMKGIPASKITGKIVDATATNTKYTIGSSDWHPYVEIQMTINGVSKTYKWATMNIGATSATDNGDYFAWGETTGHAAATASSNAFVFGTDNAGFAWKNCPFAATDNPTFNKYVPASQTSYLAEGFDGDTKTVLDLADDAANANWGGSWRMPTKAEFNALASETKDWDSTNKGYTFGTSPNTIFLPAAGFGIGSGLYYVGDDGYYWSSSLGTDGPYDACCLGFGDGYASTYDYYRCYGQSVRALSE